MARYYSTFDGSTVAALEAAVAGKGFVRVPMTGDGAALKAALISQRATLDAAARSQISTANNNGNNGTVVPSDKLVRGASNTTGTLYTNPAAVYNSDPSVRPTADITSAGSTIITGAGAVVIPNTTLDAARAAVNDAASAAGVYTRLGADGAKTLRSLYLDLAMTYFAWDNFTPYIVGSMIVFSSPTDPVKGTLTTIKMEWQNLNPVDTMEAVADWFLTCQNTGVIAGETPASTGDSSITGSGTVAVGGATVRHVEVAGTSAGLVAGMSYRITGQVQLRFPSTGVVGPMTTVVGPEFQVHNV